MFKWSSKYIWTVTHKPFFIRKRFGLKDYVSYNSELYPGLPAQFVEVVIIDVKEPLYLFVIVLNLLQDLF